MSRDNPLFLPLGSVRSIIALGFAAAGVVAMFTITDVPEWFALLLGIVIRDYFAKRGEVSPTEPEA